MLQTAQQLFSKSDYAGCQQLLDDVPPARRTDELEQLLRKARACEAEADQLWLDIREMEQKRKTDGLEMLVKRLLKLKPGHAAAKRLHQALQSYSRVPVHRRNYKYDQGRLQPLPEPSLLAQWGLLAGLTFVLAFLAVYSYVIVYLKSGSQVLQVAIDDQWLQSLGGRLTLQVDGQEHLIEVGNGELSGLHQRKNAGRSAGISRRTRLSLLSRLVQRRTMAAGADALGSSGGSTADKSHGSRTRGTPAECSEQSTASGDH
jgi:hypothetical protein